MINNFFIRNTIQNKIEDALCEIQQRYNIHSGDVQPLLKCKLDDAEDKLVEVVTEIILEQIQNEKNFAPNLGFSEANWQACLETLGFTERENPNGRDCYDVFNEDDIPCWQYEGREQQQNLYFFFSGMIAMKIQKEIHHEKHI